MKKSPRKKYWVPPSFDDDFLAVVKKEQSRCRPTDEELLAGVPWIVALVWVTRARTFDDGRTHLEMAERLSEKALWTPVDLTWKQAGAIQEARMELMSILTIGALLHAGQDISLVTLKAPPLPDGSDPITWVAFGSLLWYPPRPASNAVSALPYPIIFTFHAWDLRNAAVSLLDSDQEAVLEPLLRGNPRFARVRQLVREARQSIGSEENVRAIAAATVSEYFLNLPPEEPPLHGILADEPEPNRNRVPDWLKVAKPNARLHAIQARVVKALGQDAFGAGIESPRSKRQRVPLESVELPEVSTSNPSDGVDLLARLRSTLGADESHLVDLLLEGFTSGRKPTLPDVARQHGYELASVEAVWKRIRARAKKLR